MLAQCTTSSRSQLSKVKEGGGFERITQLLQWAALTFAAPEDRPPEASDGLLAASDSLDAVQSLPPQPPTRERSRRIVEAGDAFEGPFFKVASEEMEQAAAAVRPPTPDSASPRPAAAESPGAGKPPSARRPPLGGVRVVASHADAVWMLVLTISIDHIH